MKRYINQISKICYILIGLVIISSCRENIFKAEEFKSGLYFMNDSLDYSFGITPLEINTHTLELPVQIMGAPANYDREFQIKIVAEKTDATEGVHYELSSNLLIKADSVKGSIPLEIFRQSLEDNFFKLGIEIVENSNFIPISSDMAKMVVTFNNRIEQPNWVNWQGRKTWPTSKLGVWNPLVYIKFMEFFAAMEESAPNAYYNIINAYGGPLLPNFPGDWAWDYDVTLTKYVLNPLTQYFTVEHPELGLSKFPKH